MIHNTTFVLSSVLLLNSALVWAGDPTSSTTVGAVSTVLSVSSPSTVRINFKEQMLETREQALAYLNGDTVIPQFFDKMEEFRTELQSDSPENLTFVDLAGKYLEKTQDSEIQEN